MPVAATEENSLWQALAQPEAGGEKFSRWFTTEEFARHYPANLLHSESYWRDLRFSQDDKVCRFVQVDVFSQEKGWRTVFTAQ